MVTLLTVEGLLCAGAISGMRGSQEFATAAEAGKDDKLKLLQLSLNDRTAPIISRAGLLLLMV